MIVCTKCESTCEWVRGIFQFGESAGWLVHTRVVGWIFPPCAKHSVKIVEIYSHCTPFVIKITWNHTVLTPFSRNVFLVIMGESKFYIFPHCAKKLKRVQMPYFSFSLLLGSIHFIIEVITKFLLRARAILIRPFQKLTLTLETP